MLWHSIWSFVFRSKVKFANTRQVLLPSLFVFLSYFSLHLNAAQIVIVIDNMGNKASEKRAFNLPPEVVFSILPHTPYSTKFSELAEQQNRDVMLHMPMEALSGLYMGPGGLSSNMDKAQILESLLAAQKTVPNAIGLNNHMGSKLTQLSYPMQATMEFLSRNQMFFLDSRTTKFSKAESVAKSNGVPSMRRHVFLDHVQKTTNIQFQFARLLRKAKRNGFAIGIAHPHEVTLDFLQKALQELPNDGVTLVSMSHGLQPSDQQWAWNPASQLSR